MTQTRPRAEQIIFGDRLLSSKLGEMISPKDSPFNAIWDGVTNDTASLQAFFNHLAVNGGLGVLPAGSPLITESMTLPADSVPFTVIGAGDATVIKMRNTTNPSNSVPLAFIAPRGVLLADFVLDCGYSVTGVAGSGFSFRNAKDTTVRNVKVLDHRNAAGLMFVDSEDEQWANCHIIDCYSDSYGHGQNGFLLEGMHYSSIQNCNVAPLDPAGSPCIGLQLKNKCRHSYILGGTARGCKGGVAMGGDGVTFGDGPHKCFIRGVVTKDCLDGGVFGKSTDCQVQYHADMTNSPAPVAGAGYALNVAGFNAHLYAEVTLNGVQAGRTATRIGSDDTIVTIPHANGWGDQIALLEPGVDNLRLTVVTATPGFASLASEITNNSGTATNRGVYVAGSLMTAL